MPQHFVVPVGTGVSVGSGVVTYSGLITSVGLWLERSDLQLLIPDFITLFEARMNRILRVPEMEAVETLTVDADENTAALPSDWLEIRHLYVDGDTRYEVLPKPLSAFRTSYPTASSTGNPKIYAVVGDDIHLAPAPSEETDLELHYYEKIPALSPTNETNWLITSHPDIYLRGVLLEAEFYGWNDERLPLIKMSHEEALEELKAQGVRKHHGGGPLYPMMANRP